MHQVQPSQPHFEVGAVPALMGVRACAPHCAETQATIVLAVCRPYPMCAGYTLACNMLAFKCFLRFGMLVQFSSDVQLQFCERFDLSSS